MHEQQFVVVNGLIKVVFNSHGEIIQLRDVSNDRELVDPAQPANVMRYFEDIPLYWDAWDVK